VPDDFIADALVELGAFWNHKQKRAETERGCVRSTSRSGTARPRVLGSFGDFGHPHLLRLVLPPSRRAKAPLRRDGGGHSRGPVVVPRCAPLNFVANLALSRRKLKG